MNSVLNYSISAVVETACLQKPDKLDLADYQIHIFTQKVNYIFSFVTLD